MSYVVYDSHEHNISVHVSPKQYVSKPFQVSDSGPRVFLYPATLIN